MNKFINSCLISSLIVLFGQINFAYSEDYSVEITIPQSSINNPLSLPVWSLDSGITSSGSDSWSTAGSTIGSGIPTAMYSGLWSLLNSRKLQRSRYINVKLTTDAHDFDAGEEVLYEMQLRNSKDTPLYSDTVMYIRIPEWLQYTEGSLKINDDKLTDIKDNDSLTYLKDKSLLVLDLNKQNAKKIININFISKVQAEEPDKDMTLCLIKFKSDSKKIETGWKALIYGHGQQPVEKNNSI